MGCTIQPWRRCLGLGTHHTQRYPCKSWVVSSREGPGILSSLLGAMGIGNHQEALYLRSKLMLAWGCVQSHSWEYYPLPIPNTRVGDNAPLPRANAPLQTPLIRCVTLRFSIAMPFGLYGTLRGIPNIVGDFGALFLTPIRRINALCNKPMHTGILPILWVLTQSMAYRIVMNIIIMDRKIFLITNKMLPITTLPEISFSSFLSWLRNCPSNL